MKPYLDDAKSELRRADHLIFVSLKYTRTVDVLKNTIERFINTFDIVMEGILKKKKVEEIPVSPSLKCDLIKKKVRNDEKLHEYLDFYGLLRKLSRAKFTRSREFRRHVTMTATFDDGEIFEVNIDRIHEFNDKTKKFVEYVEENFK